MPVSRWHDDELRHAVERAVESGLNEVCHKLVNYCRRRMREGPQTGRTYVRSRIARTSKGVRSRRPGGYLSAYVRSSAPGEYPAVQSGTLWRSISWETTGRLRRAFGTNIWYGRDLELGNPARHLAPRPYLRMTVAAITGREAEVHFRGKLQ